MSRSLRGSQTATFLDETMNDNNRIILITGAARGIGRAIALALAQPGLTIYLNDVVLGEEAARTQQEVEAKGAQVRLVEFNVADAAMVSQGVDRIVKECGRIDILVNNAGITRDNLILRMKETEWDAVLGVNLKGAFNCIRAVAKPMLKQRRGRIINIS